MRICGIPECIFERSDGTIGRMMKDTLGSFGREKLGVTDGRNLHFNVCALTKSISSSTAGSGGRSTADVDSGTGFATMVVVSFGISLGPSVCYRKRKGVRDTSFEVWDVDASCCGDPNRCPNREAMPLNML